MKRDTATLDPKELDALIACIKRISKRYKELTGKPLGVTGEIAEYEAASKLGLKLANARQEGFDAIRIKSRRKHQIQIKGRCITSKKRGQKLPAINMQKNWDSVIYVELDANLEPVVMREASRSAIQAKLVATTSKARQRGVLSTSMFKAISGEIWKKC